MRWPEEIWSAVPRRKQPLVIPSLDEEARFPEAARFFRDCGSQSLCVLALTTSLNRLGALCIGRERRDAFSEQESSLLSLVSHYAALAIEERLNFAQSELARAQLEEERTKLRLILDLNNRVVSNLELREVIQVHFSRNSQGNAPRWGGFDFARWGGPGTATLCIGFPGSQCFSPPGSAAFAQWFCLRPGVSHREALDRGYRAIAKVGPGLQNRVRSRRRDAYVCCPCSGAIACWGSLPGADREECLYRIRSRASCRRSPGR